MAKPVRIVLVGVGGYGDHYVSAILGDGGRHGVEWVGAVDPAIEKCRHLAALRERGVPAFDSLAAFHAAAGVADLTVLSTPIQTHAPLSLAALEQGSHVLCEKPVAATVQDARAMAAAAKRCERFLAVGFQWSFADATQALKADVMAGLFGSPIRLKTLVSWPRFASYYGRAAWAGALKGAAGEWILDSPVNNATAHYLHNMLYLLGPSRETAVDLQSVQAELYRANPIGNYDTAALRCQTVDDGEILFYTSHAVPSNFGPVCHYEFEEATVFNAGEVDQTAFVARFKNGAVKRYDIPDATACNKLWQCVEAVRGGPPPACTAETASAHLLCVNGAQQSLERVVEFSRESIQVDLRGDDDSLTWVPELQGVLVACFAANRMPAELGSLGWARAGRVVDLTTYREFPADLPV